MNINQRIPELGPGGLPRYNKKCNELTRAVNWLLGMTTSNGKVISDGGRGPVINISNPLPQAPQAPTIQNFQPGKTSGIETPPSDNPIIDTIPPLYSPIIPPNFAPTIYLSTYDDPGVSPGTAPTLLVGNGLNPGDSPTPFQYDFQITYEGTEIFHVSGSATASYPGPSYIPLDHTGWEFDPKNLAGYSFGRQDWIYRYNGSASNNSNPIVIETFTYSFTTNMDYVFWPVTFLAA